MTRTADGCKSGGAITATPSHIPQPTLLCSILIELVTGLTGVTNAMSDVW